MFLWFVPQNWPPGPARTQAGQGILFVRLVPWEWPWEPDGLRYIIWPPDQNCSSVLDAKSYKSCVISPPAPGWAGPPGWNPGGEADTHNPGSLKIQKNDNMARSKLHIGQQMFNFKPCYLPYNYGPLGNGQLEASPDERTPHPGLSVRTPAWLFPWVSPSWRGWVLLSTWSDVTSLIFIYCLLLTFICM